MRQVRSPRASADMPPPEDIDRYYILIRTAMDDGTLPANGSVLPYLRFTLNAALDGQALPAPEEPAAAAVVPATV